MAIDRKTQVPQALRKQRPRPDRSGSIEATGTDEETMDPERLVEG
jgi:hypothetical protein